MLGFTTRARRLTIFAARDSLSLARKSVRVKKLEVRIARVASGAASSRGNMGCAASLTGGTQRSGRWTSRGLVGPDPRMLDTIPGASAASEREAVARRHTMRHTPSLRSEPAQRLQSFALEMSKTGRLELTSIVSREGSDREMGTLTKQQLPSLQQVPGVVFGMTRLVELNLRCNEIKTVPKEIALLRELQVLNVSENRISELPREIVGLSRLRTLDIAENSIRRLPDDLGNLTRLETLRANRNRLASLPSSITKCARLKVVNLYNNVIKTIGDDISELCELEELNVSNNQLVFFPEVRRWKNLKALFLQTNKLLTLPAMDALCNLETFTVQQNRLKEFPNMDNLDRLKKIDASTNQISVIPSCFEHMSSLVHLSMRKNLVTSIPAFLCRCKHLEIIDLGSNPLMPPVPVDFVLLPNLKTLLLDGGSITTVPIELMGLQQVCRVNLGSRLRMDDQETCEVVTELRAKCAQNGGWFKTG